MATNDSDVDHGAKLTYTLNATVPGLTFNADGSYSFDAGVAAYQALAKGETQVVVANYTVADEYGSAVTSTLTITVAGTNDAPVAKVDVAVATEDAPALVGTVATNDSDVDNGAKLSFQLSTPVPGLTLATNGGYVFNPADIAYQGLAQGETQTIVASYEVTDEQGTTSFSALIITITGTNDAPVAVADVASVTEDAALISGSVAANDYDVDGGAKLSYALNATVAGLTLNPDGSYSFDASNAAYQSLALGQTTQVVANYTTTDQFGATGSSTLTITVTGTNDAPIAVADSATVNEDANIAGSVAANDSDIDQGALLSYALGAPVPGLIFNADGSYSFNAANSAYQSLALGEVKTIVAAYTVTDGQGATSTSALTITVTGTNDTPVAIADSNTVIEDAVVTGSVAANDGDVDAGAVLGYALSAPVAGLTFNADGSYSFDAANAAYQSLAAGAVRTVVAGYTVTDENGAVATSALTIVVTGTNDLPVARPDATAVNEDASVTGSVATNDSDVDAGTTLSYTLTNPVAGLIFNANGSYTFNAANAVYQQLAQGEVQTIVANYTVSDGQGGTATSALTITVTGRNDGPIAVADTATAVEDGAKVTGNVGANDSDVDHNAMLTYTATNTVAGLTIAADGSYSFDPSNTAYQNLGAGATRVVTGTYRVTDEFGAVSNSSLAITVTGTNDAPVVGNVTLLANRLGNGGFDLKPDFSGWTISTASSGTTAVATSTATINRSGTVIAGDTAVAQLNYSATVAFDSKATPGNYKSGFGPSITSNAFAGNAGDVVKFVYQLSSGGDQAIGTGYIRDAVTGAIVQEIFNYKTPFTGSTGVQTVTLTLATSGNYTIDFRVGSYDATNGGLIGARLDIGFAGILADGVGEDTPFTFTTGRSLLLANATDVDVGDTLTIDPFTTTSAKGVSIVMGADGQLVIDARGSAEAQALAQGQTTTDTFTYQVSDGHGGLTTATASYTLAGANDAPVASAATAAAIEGAAIVAGSLVGSATDVDAGAVLGFKLVAPIAGLTINADGSYTFDPTNAAYDDVAEGQVRPVVANYQVTDQFGAVSTSTLTITVTGTNDGPVAVSDALTAGEDDTTIFTGVSLVANDTDIDGDVLSVTAVGTTGTLGSVSLVNGDVSYAAGSAFQYLKAGQTATDSFTYTISDGRGGTSTATETVTIVGANDGPVAVNDKISAVAGAATTFAVIGNDTDIDGDTLSIASVTQGTYGAVTVNADGTLSYTAAANAAAADSFTYTVKDAGGLTSTATVSVAVDRLPVAVTDTYTVNGGGTTKLAVTTNDTDPDNDALKIVSVGTAAHGSLTINADNTVSYAGAVGYSGTDTFQYTISDGRGGLATGTVNLNVTPPEKAVAPTLIVGSGATINPTNGAAMMTQVVLNAGDAVSFQWNFATDDYAPYEDFAFATVNGAVFSLSNTQATGDRGATGWQTFTYTAATAGTYSIGQGVMNARDQAVNSFLGVDAIRVNGAIVQSFENGLTGSTIIGNVKSTVSGSGQYATILPTNGQYEAFISSNPASAAMIENFLGLTTGRLQNINKAQGLEYQEITVPIGIKIAATAHPDDTFVTITGAPAGSVFNHGTYNAANGSWKISAADVAGNLTITTPSNYAGTFALSVTATSVVYGSNTSATTSPMTQTVTVAPASVDLTAASTGSTLIGGTMNDILHSGVGNDTLTGGAGNDLFLFTKGSGSDVITDFQGGAGAGDVIQLKGMGFASFADVSASAFQAADGVHIDLHNGDSLVLTGVNLTTLAADDFLFA